MSFIAVANLDAVPAVSQGLRYQPEGARPMGAPPAPQRTGEGAADPDNNALLKATHISDTQSVTPFLLMWLPLSSYPDRPTSCSGLDSLPTKHLSIFRQKKPLRGPKGSQANFFHRKIDMHSLWKSAPFWALKRSFLA